MDYWDMLTVKNFLGGAAWLALLTVNLHSYIQPQRHWVHLAMAIASALLMVINFFIIPLTRGG